MSDRQALKSTLKRGALVAAANWPVTLIQATADSLLKLLIAIPVLGGVFLVALVIGAEPQSLITPDWREMAPTIVTALLSRPAVLALFLLAVAVVGIGGSLFVFLIKGGTVSVLARSEREADTGEPGPGGIEALARCSRFSVDFFIDAARAQFPAFARLGMILLTVYAVSAAAYLAGLGLGPQTGGGVAFAAGVTMIFVVWITVVNLVYLLVQIVIAADGLPVASAMRRVAAFLRKEGRAVSRIFVVVLGVVVAATGASLLAAAALSLIWFVPFVGVAVLPLQLAAGLLRALVFQYIGLTSIGAYLSVYRRFTSRLADGRAPAAPYPDLARQVSES